MNLSQQIANQFREVILDGKWICNTNLRAQLDDLTWKEATTQIGNLNTIAVLAYHINYYVAGLVQVLEGGPLNIRDKYSFDMPPVTSQEAWERLRNKVYNDTNRFIELIAQLSDEEVHGPFMDEQYGTFYRNLTGMIEHAYYHLGQIVLIKKLVLAQE